MNNNDTENKNIILYLGKIQSYIPPAIKNYENEYGKKFRIAVLHDSHKLLDEKTKSLIDIDISCDLTNDVAIQKALLPYESEIAAFTCRGEDLIPLYAKVIPHLPYLKNPNSESLIWASDKILMRRRLFNYNKKITPAYTLISNTDKKSLEKIEKKVGYPLIVKPTGLAASRLVTICYHREELEKSLKKILRSIKQVYKKTGYTNEPKILVEQFMDGEMYSIDGYVTSRGKLYFCPMVHVKTGRAIGFDDFFGYQQMTPTLLKKESITQAQKVATEATHALALRSTTVHVELMKTEKGWKIIELGARVGGFRQQMYEYSFGINHTINDVLIHMPEKPIIPQKVKGYTVAMKFFAKKEGRLTNLTGIKKAQDLESFKSISINKKIGDMCTFAKNGGSSVFNIILFNKERSKLLADIRRLEQSIEIQTKRK